MSKLLCGAVALAALAFAQPTAATTALYAKQGATVAEIDATDKLCAEQARRAPVRRTTQASQYIAPAVVGGPLGLASAALLGGAIEGVHQGREVQRRQAACMRMKGYAKLTLTEQEEADYAKAGSKGREDWTQRFVAGDISQRVAAGLKPAVPPLPKVNPEPFAIGGLKLEPASLTAASVPVMVKGDLVTGKATHRQVAKAVSALDKKLGLVRIGIEPGTAFYAVDYRSSADPEQEVSSAWCGETETSGMFGSHAPTHCLVSDFTGYRLLMQDDYAGQYAPRKPWLTGPLSQGPGNFLISDGELVLEPSAEDPFGPMDVTLTVAKLGNTDVSLVASAQKDGKSVDVWRGTLPFDAEGRAVLPFWDHRLKLTHKGDAVEVAYTADGDGRGWIDPPKAEPSAVASTGAP